MSIRLPINPETLSTELAALKATVEKWQKIIDTQGVPGIDTPGREDVLDEFLREFCGELRLVSGKCATIADVIDEGMKG
jgi:hypothetical protein